MKWYFACNDKSEEFFPLIKGAVISAAQNTNLKPHFIYDGEENELTDWLRKHNVKIIFHKVSFFNQLEKYYTDKNLLKIASGAFLRCDIPVIEQEDDFILYTDCDVLFLKDFQTDLSPNYFACAPEINKKNYQYFNSGVMVMNVKNLKNDYDNFTKFITENLNSLKAFDQCAYQIFYKNKNSKLPLIYNHKPYWGIDENALIVHFHGCKPTNFVADEQLKNFPPVLWILYKKDKNAYDFYLNLFKKYYPEIDYCFEGIEKLKNGEYPLNKIDKFSLRTKIKNYLIKNSRALIQKFN